MVKSNVSFFASFLWLILLCSCAPKTSIETTIQTEPNGARIFIDGTEALQATPFDHVFEFDEDQEYDLFVQKEGYFEEEFLLTKDLPSLTTGHITIPLTRSPLWEATTFSQVTNTSLQIHVDKDINMRESWEILLDSVIKRSPALKELNFESGYLQTNYIVKKFETKNGEFLLRCQFTAALISSDPIIYRIKEVAEWSGNGVQWHSYNRIFFEHDDMIREVQNRMTKKQM